MTNSKSEVASTLNNIGKTLSPISRSQKLQDEAAKYYFDWPEIEPVLDKIEEEITELREAIISKDEKNIKAEMGDILFACINLARHLHVDADSALSQTNEKFIRRFDYVVKQMQLNGIAFSPKLLEQMEVFWQQSKKFNP